MENGAIIGIVIGSVIAFGLLVFLMARYITACGMRRAAENENPANPQRAADDESSSGDELVFSPTIQPEEDENFDLHSCKSFWTAAPDDNPKGKYWARDSMSPTVGGGFPAFPSCTQSTLHDWGLGVKACWSCGARPIRNRGCLHCNKPMCMTCFEAHKTLKTSTLILAKAAITKYDKAHRGSLLLSEWNELLGDLGVPPQSEEEFVTSCKVRGSDPKTVGITKDHLVVLVTFLTPNTSQALARLVPQSEVGSEGLCQQQERIHDWGPGLTSCSGCKSMPIFNRGCRICNRRMCQKCWEKHRRGGDIEDPASPLRTVPQGAAAADMSGSLSFGRESTHGVPPSQGGEEAAAPRCPSVKEVEEEAEAPAGPVCTFDFPPDFGSDVPVESKAKVVYTWNVLDDEDSVKKIGLGGSTYYFTFLKGTHLTRHNLEMCSKLMNLTSFGNEAAENHVPFVDPLSEHDMNDYIFMLNKAVYLLPPFVDMSMLTTSLLVDKDYQAKCQPGGPKIMDTTEADTFRFKKTIIWPVYSLTIQFKVSVVDPKHYPALSSLQEGLPVHHALLLERTKRNKMAEDLIRKAKSILLYHKTPGGTILVTNVTTAAATSVPAIVASVVDKLGSMGAKDVAETATRTRKYFVSKNK
eukprot:TRINITY_DN935_c0_g1_i1.p1 TRINITY_DN935_c0_g1~~TRINITY_DN935_c0_g1_i1.p1  ORF type:complete len:638 (+),score=181.87 TRINITY_DN935_c0_g1_i1:246-2159(+)